MPLPGTGFLAIWNDVADGAEAEWLTWHTREHMRERADIPGFLAARRYRDPASRTHRYFTIYPADSLSTFSSAPYRDRLDNPTPWTRRTMPTFRNFLRGACRTLASSGDGMGGAILTLRLEGLARSPLASAARAQALCDTIAGAAPLAEGIVAAHLGLADAATTALPSRERETRGAVGEPVFEAVLIVEALRRDQCRQATATVAAAVRTAAPEVAIAFEGLYGLELALSGRSS